MYKFVSRWMLAALILIGTQATFAASNRLSSAAKGINTAKAPVPTPLLDGKKVFVSFEMSDVLAFPTVYSGGPERAYDEFFNNMKQWGHYDLVLNPQDADLIFSIRFVEGGLSWPQMRLSISDAKTRVVLWGFIEEVNGAVFKKHRDQAFSNTVMKLVNDVQELLAPGSPQPFPQVADPSKAQQQNQQNPQQNSPQ